MIVGLLALQGDYQAHELRAKELGFSTKKVATAADLESVTALIIPGGESSVFLKLLSPELKASIQKKVSAGLPTLATCAGVILLAKNVENPAQESLNLIDIDVRRNAYGRQVDSFITPELLLTEDGRLLASKDSNQLSQSSFEGVFIRAPRITRIGNDVSTIFEYKQEPVGVRYRNILALTFHPELTPEFQLPYQFLASQS